MRRRRHHPRPRTRPRQVLAAVLVALSLWAFLDSVSLYDEARASPLGARRSVALAFLGPVARVAAATGADWPVDAIDRLIGRTAPSAPGSSAGPAVVAAGHRAEPGRARVGGSGPAAAVTGAGGPGAPPGAVPVDPVPVDPVPPPPPGPQRVLVIGDSLGRDLGEGLAQVWAGSAAVSVVDDARSATGLARPDYFDWAGQLQRDLAARPASLVVVMVGGNDGQPMEVDGTPAAFGSPRWDAAYRARVDTLLEEAAAAGARVAWVGIPVCASASFSADMAHLDGIYRAATAGDAGAYYFDTWKLFETAAGAYSAYLPDAGGSPRLVRQPDGIHLTVDGVSRLDSALVSALRSRGWLPGG